MRSLRNMASKKQLQSRALEARFEALLGGHGTTSLMARALNRSPSTLHRIWAAQVKAPGELTALAELLEACPPDLWPERWRR